jgi:signal transduction histidine kinase
MASKQQFKLKEMISQVLGSFMLQSDELNASIDVDIAPDDLEIHSVRGYFHSVIHNLVSNGLKYRHPSRAPKLRINAYTTNTDLVMIFTDNGLGMDMKQVGEKMFKLYKRFHSHVEGKGMGLFLVKTQVERIGGTISVRSVLGKGTAFRVVIPLEDYQPITTETDSESV